MKFVVVSDLTKGGRLTAVNCSMIIYCFAKGAKGDNRYEVGLVGGFIEVSADGLNALGLPSL